MKKRGFGLVVALITLAVTTILAAAAASVMKVLLRDSLYQERLLQAQLIAESGAEAALARLSRDGAWRQGFKRKAFGGGYYDVSLSSGAMPLITATGHSTTLLPFGRAHRKVSFKVQALPIPQMRYALMSDEPLSIVSGASLAIDSYDSSLDPDPRSFSDRADVLTNKNLLISGAQPAVFGNAVYGAGQAPFPQTVTGGIVKAEDPSALPSESGSAYANDNDGSTGISPSWMYRFGRLSVPVNSTATIRSGVYYLQELRVAGRLTTQTTDGPVVIFLNGPLTVTGAFFNSSRIPGNLVLYGQGSGTWTLDGYGYLHGVLVAPRQNILLAQTLFGAVAGRQISMTRGRLHYDVSLARPRSFVTRILAGTWAASP